MKNLPRYGKSLHMDKALANDTAMNKQKRSIT